MLATEAPAVGSLAVKDMLRPVGSATALSRSDSSILRYSYRRSVDVVCAIKSSQLSRLKSANRLLCPLNRSTLSYARTEIPSLSAQLSAEMGRHLLPPRCSTPPPREGGLAPRSTPRRNLQPKRMAPRERTPSTYPRTTSLPPEACGKVP